MQRNTELRKLPAASLSNIAHILEINNDWQKVVCLIPKNLESNNFERKYNNEQINLMEKYAKETKRNYAEVLFDEWGTSGRVRPTVDTLMKILQQAEILRAVDEIAHMLGEPVPPRPDFGPGAEITTNLTDILNNESVEQRLRSMETVGSDHLQNSSQDHVLCNRTTRQLEIPSEEIPNISLLHRADQSEKEVSDMMKFPTTERSLAPNVPDISALCPDSSIMYNNTGSSMPSDLNDTSSSVSNTTDSSTQNELSQFTPNENPHYSKSNMDIFGIIDMAILDDKKLVPFEYRELEVLTDKFSETLVHKPSGPVGKIGSGGFGDVYVGTHKNHGALAVKRVKLFYQISSELTTAIKVFNTEVKSLSYLRHENIVPIFGYSIDGPTPCIVCKYIDGGSLQEKIAAKVLTEKQRMDIMRGTAEGLKYIHHSERPLQSDEVLSDTVSQSSRKSYYLHGDVKSANILLTKDCIPKLCDFGLAKQLDTTLFTRSVMGTSAYMAPEGFSGTITQKNDIFSFGIVLLELITGLKPIVTLHGESINIKNYVEEACPDGNITKLLDRVVPKWNNAQKVYDLAKQCLAMEKNKRPSIDNVCSVLNEINKSNDIMFWP